MKTKLFICLLLCFVLFASFVSANQDRYDVTIHPALPIDSDDLQCNVISTLYFGFTPYTYKWFVNNIYDSTENSSVYPNSKTHAGDTVLCQVFTHPNLYLGESYVIVAENPPSSQIQLTTYSLLQLSLPTFLNAFQFNSAPVAFFVFRPTAPTVGQSILFNASKSHDLDLTDSIVEYRWDFGDGTDLITLPGPLVLHSYSALGIYTVTLTVVNSRGQSSSASSILIVDPPDRIPQLNRPPIANAGNDQVIIESTLITLDGSLSYDPDGDALVEYRWDFGDGTSFTSTQPLVMPVVTHQYILINSVVTVFTVTLTVKDSRGAIDTDTVDIIVLPRQTPGKNLVPPTAVIDAPLQAFVGQTISLFGNRSIDADGTIVTYFWNFGDTSVSSGVNDFHAYAMPGLYTITLTVTDNDGLTNTATVVILVKAIDRTDPNGPFEKPNDNPYGLDGKQRNFKLSRVMPQYNNFIFSRGETAYFDVKMTNEGYDEPVRLRVRVPDFDYYYLSNYELDMSEVNWITFAVPVPTFASLGSHIIIVELVSREGERRVREYSSIIIE